MKRMAHALILALLVLTYATTASAESYPAPYFNSFENISDASEDPADTNDDTMFYVTRVSTGTNGIESASGDWHAEAGVTDFGPDFIFTRYGGYNDVFPPGGYNTSIDIYLDMNDSIVGEYIQFDWSSAINTPTGGHRRDFIFSVGTDGEGGYVMSASNNAPGWPANPNRDPLYISISGWYTFEHIFYDDGGLLVVDMRVLDDSGNVLSTWTLSAPFDIIGDTVGGNRYGWMVTNGFDRLALDNVTRSGAVAQAKDQCKKNGWEAVFRSDGSAFKNQGDCIQYVNTGK